jgi:hypothetical protein
VNPVPETGPPSTLLVTLVVADEVWWMLEVEPVSRESRNTGAVVNPEFHAPYPEPTVLLAVAVALSRFGDDDTLLYTPMALPLPLAIAVKRLMVGDDAGVGGAAISVDDELYPVILRWPQSPGREPPNAGVRLRSATRRRVRRPHHVTPSPDDVDVVLDVPGLEIGIGR